MKLFAIALVIALALAATSAVAQSEAQRSFDKLKTLVGTWEGKTSQGQTAQVTFRLTGGGSALLSEIDHENMISVFHLDGDRLLMTHYCAAGNQPRMVGRLSPDGKTLTFDFLDATNLASSQAGHMNRVVFILPDATHQVEEWTFLSEGKERTEVFTLARKN